MSVHPILDEIARNLPFTPLSGPVSVSGGCIHDTWRWGPYFIKTNEVGNEDVFRSEAESLSAIAATASIRVPETIAIGATREAAFLVLEHLDLVPSGNNGLFGEQLAELHRHQSGTYGFHSDNFIGSTPQPNRPTQLWSRFFRNSRLDHQFALLRSIGIRFWGSDALLERVPDLLPADPGASLLHGDLWSGNRAFLRDGTPVIFDPACYYGHAACDLAMTKLFGTFGQAFYDAYRSSSDLYDPCCHELYNLYHLLNHALLFGGGYVARSQAIIRRFV